MNYWIFKLSDQSHYADIPGRQYVYDNTHSVKVETGDHFIYLDKTNNNYELTAAGRVGRVTSRKPKASECHNVRVQRVFTASCMDVVWFSQPVELTSRSRLGRQNRTRLGLPDDVNTIGWSISMPRISHELFIRLLDAGFEADTLPDETVDPATWRIEDSYSIVRVRKMLHDFRSAVLSRHGNRCVVCGTSEPTVLEAAHIRSYAADPANRANPANGLCLCRFCHGLFDSGQLAIACDGQLMVCPDLMESADLVTGIHLNSVDSTTRKGWLTGADGRFLLERCQRLFPP